MIRDHDEGIQEFRVRAIELPVIDPFMIVTLDERFEIYEGRKWMPGHASETATRTGHSGETGQIE